MGDGTTGEGVRGAGRASETVSAERYAAATARLRQVGQRVTLARVLILDALTTGDHLSAEEIVTRVADHAPEVSRSTVYRTLETFRQRGIISETDLGGGVRHFELLGPDRHHHLICHACGGQTELDDVLVQPLREGIVAGYGFDPDIEHLAIFGTCAACRADPDHPPGR